MQCYQSAVSCGATKVLFRAVQPKCCVVRCYQSAVSCGATKVLCRAVLPKCCVVQCYQSAVLYGATKVLCRAVLTKVLCCSVLPNWCVVRCNQSAVLCGATKVLCRAVLPKCCVVLCYQIAMLCGATKVLCCAVLPKLKMTLYATFHYRIINRFSNLPPRSKVLTFQFLSCSRAVPSSFLCNPSSCSSFCWIFPLEKLPTPRRSEWWSSLPQDCFVSRGSISHICRCFGKRLSRKSNNVVVFPFAFHIAVQQPFKPLWLRLLLDDLEPSQASFALRFRSLLMTLRPASEEFYRRSLLLGISLHLVPTLLTCPAWETLLVEMLPPA